MTTSTASCSDSPFHDAREDLESAESGVGRETPQSQSPSYRLAYADSEFLLRDELRGVRLQLELMKPELVQRDLGVCSTVVIFGSTRIPEPAAAQAALVEAERAAAQAPEDAGLARALAVAQRVAAKARYYDEARRLGQIITEVSQTNGHSEFVVVTGGGPGIMEAANRGAQDVGGKSIGLSIVLPQEARPNPYVTPELSFQFHYFAVRKMHFLLRAKALVVFPGGYGTLDELFETLTLIQTKKVEPVPVLLFGRAYWQRVINFEVFAEEGTIAPADLELFQYVETAEEAWDAIQRCYGGADEGCRRRT
ncbi:TIGR00730 family Rossman fold protein [Lamprobacter modestohalophilus]|uniref:LOG family protein n=1 Tax=Lamprobacter modestohalophilus TaxID=1064514 RepID=UPI002ADEFA6E|nr:TIGR00730 family Rossman fold protein [Lamprobacter modestohalophilus]MEA1052963.1 TIGR00730 family Rossman fold protein [Lamprobacter modestohalophilus]